MNSTTAPIVYVCCFCGDTVQAAEDQAWYLTLRGDAGVGAQDLFVHRGCLRQRVDASVPLLSDLCSEETVDA